MGESRFVRSIKHECLNRGTPFGERHLHRTIAEYVEHYHGSGITKDSTTNSSMARPRSTASHGFAGARDSAGCSIITIARRNETRESIRGLGSRMRHYGL